MTSSSSLHESESGVCRDVDVVVVGSGLAGLTAAQSLKRGRSSTSTSSLSSSTTSGKGIGGGDSPPSVVILEAHDTHIGGRVRQVEGLVPWPVEAGPEFIHGGSRSVLKALLDEYHLETDEHDWPDKFWFEKRMPLEKRWVVDPESDETIQKADALFEHMYSETSSVDSSILEYLRRRGEPQDIIDIAESCYANDFGTSLDKMGVFEISEEARHWSYDEKYLVVRESLGELVSKLKEGLDIAMGCAVANIIVRDDDDKDANKRKIQVQCTDGRCFMCDQVIMTTPHSTMRTNNVRFSPPLPEEKSQAVQKVGMGDAIKVFLVFKERFWPKELFDVICPGAFVPEMWITKHTPTKSASQCAKGEHMITCFLAGKAAEAARAVSSKEELVAKCVAQLDEMFRQGNAPPAGTMSSANPATEYLVASHVEDWAVVPYIRGAYTYPSAYAAGARMWLSASTHNGRIFYAGEATNANGNPCMQAAIESGHRAASEIMLRRCPPRQKL